MNPLEQERAAAAAAVPTGYALATEGLVKDGDLIWGWATGTWSAVIPPLPFVRGQKRPGSRQVTQLGDNVTRYMAVARPL